MLKRICSLLLLWVILFAVIPGASALSKEEQYQAALEELTAYMSCEREVALDNVFQSFMNLGAYKNSTGFMLYAKVLAGIEKNDYSYVQSSLNFLRMDDEFEKVLKECGFGSIDDLENYANGRKAETQNDGSEAMQLYQKCISYRDSYSRLISMQSAIYEEKYQEALRCLNLDTYEGYKSAVTLFKELAEQKYRDSEAYLTNAEIMMEIMRPCEHEWQEANCLQARTCALCGETDGQKGDHTWQAATCEIPKTCSVCKLTEGSPLGHSWQAAACENPETCRRCGETRGTAKGHVWQEATCKTPKTCRVCSKTAGTVKAHDWQPATTSKPETCSVCGLTRGKPLLQAGDIVTFGAYEQDNNMRNGKEPIEWEVLEIRGNKALLISKYGLDAKPYHTSGTDVTWETCTLREWLNGEFLNAAFTYEERSGILVTNVDNGSSSGYNSRSSGNNTKDKIFLLSYAEANKYFVENNNANGSTGVRVAPTAYTEVQGAYIFAGYRTVEGKIASTWWLRSRGSMEQLAINVGTNGYFNVDGSYVNYADRVVRPALWVELNSSYIGF